MSSFAINEVRLEDAVVLACAGRLDNNAAGILEASLAPLLAAGTRRLALDLSGVDYLSSAGLRSILVSLKKVTVAGGTLVLCGVGANVLEVLKLSGFEAILKIYPDREAALRAGR
jgi:anti-anti-sigma factor